MIPKVIRGVPVLMGAELNILDFDGNIDLSEYYLKKIDYAVASLHTPVLTITALLPIIHGYLNVMENPYVNIIGHPDDSRLPADWQKWQRQLPETINCWK